MIDSTAPLVKKQQDVAFQSYVKPNYEQKDSETNIPNIQSINITQNADEYQQLINQQLLDESQLSFNSSESSFSICYLETQLIQIQNLQYAPRQSSQQSLFVNQARFFQVFPQKQGQWSEVLYEEVYKWLLRQYRHQQVGQYWSLDLSQDTSSQQQPQTYEGQKLQEGSWPFGTDQNYPILCIQDLHIHQENENSSFLIDDWPSNNKQNKDQKYRYIPPPMVTIIQDMKRIYQQINFNLQDVLIVVEGQHSQPQFLSEQFQDQNLREESLMVPFLLSILSESKQQ